MEGTITYFTTAIQFLIPWTNLPGSLFLWFVWCGPFLLIFLRVIHYISEHLDRGGFTYSSLKPSPHATWKVDKKEPGITSELIISPMEACSWFGLHYYITRNTGSRLIILNFWECDTANLPLAYFHFLKSSGCSETVVSSLGRPHRLLPIE